MRKFINKFIEYIKSIGIKEYLKILFIELITLLALFLIIFYPIRLLFEYNNLLGIISLIIFCSIIFFIQYKITNKLK